MHCLLATKHAQGQQQMNPVREMASDRSFLNIVCCLTVTSVGSYECSCCCDRHVTSNCHGGLMTLQLSTLLQEISVQNHAKCILLTLS